MLLSVCYITYNHKQYISQAIAGFVMQKTNFPFEIIISDDCSNDGTQTIIKRYEQKYPKLIHGIYQKKNVGVLRNVAEFTLPKCKGKYLALCEGDDFWTDPFKLQKQVDFLESNPDYGMVHSDVNHYYEKEKRLELNYNKTHGISFPSGNIFDEYIKGDLFIKTASVVVKRALFIEAYDFDLFKKKEWLLLDLPTWLAIAQKTKIKYLPETTATYRLTEESASRTKDSLKLHKFHLSAYEILYFFSEKYSKDIEAKKNLNKKYAGMLMGDSYSMKDLNLAKKAICFYRESNLFISWKEWIKYLIIFFHNISQ
jgi:glycosyltransferase involved in cell wall biosynthesis